MRVLVTGSRDWSDALGINAVLEEIDIAYPTERVTLVSGACPTGADAMCETIARAFGWDVERHPADWRTFGKRAGYLRNQEMVDLGADVCLAFIRNKSKGATMTAMLAEGAGIPTRRFLA